ncbi:hypothetical protein T069G_03297 [Trichoderma breve]|uniref:Uncharacterized protein n=1 Tax=Trichoderma breve TaxID=2034170 RepID=A0A9W9BFF7_9HYPO|nr:hypothetical protein T069G_03297 [Trichoderma breve]KAJ4862343.1 hypothetical protein T069G_03297 [Trichoderma breve]
MANHDDNGRQNRNNGYNNGYSNGQYYDNQSNGRSNNYNGYNNGYSNGCGGNNYNAFPYAAYPPQMMVSRREERRMNRRMRKAERKARDADMVLSLMNSGSRAGPRSTLPQYSNMQPQPGNGGVPYMQRGDNSRSQAMYHPAQQGIMDPEPEGSQWRDIQSRDRPTSRGDPHPASSSESLPTYEQVVRKSGKS